MHGIRGIISKIFSKLVLQFFLMGVAVLICFLFIGSWPQWFLSLRQYLPRDISMKWFMSFSSLNTISNLQLAEQYNNLAGIHISQGEFAQAMTEYNKAVEIENASAIPYCNRALLYIKLGKVDLALKDFIKVIAMDPGNASAYYYRGMLYYHLKKYDQARGDVYKAQKLGIKVDPGLISMLKRSW